MSEAYRTTWSFGGVTPETRDHLHEVALREARIASEYRGPESLTPVRESFLTRLRHAFAGPSEPEACNCPA